MTANTANRKEARQELARLLELALTGTGKPVEVVTRYASRMPLEKRKTPVVSVVSGGTSRRKSGMNDARWNSEFVLEVWSFVRVADEANGWTEENVEDMLDDIDKMIADCVADNRVNAHWSYIELSEEDSNITPDTEIGYIVELRRVRVKKVDG